MTSTVLLDGEINDGITVETILKEITAKIESVKPASFLA
jgi:hypothetical protein